MLEMQAHHPPHTPGRRTAGSLDKAKNSIDYNLCPVESKHFDLQHVLGWLVVGTEVSQPHHCGNGDSGCTHPPTEIDSPLSHRVLWFPKLLLLNITAKLCIYSLSTSQGLPMDDDVLRCGQRTGSVMCLGVTACSRVHSFRCPGIKRGCRSKFLNQGVSCFTRRRHAQYLCGHVSFTGNVKCSKKRLHTGK